MHTMRKIDVEIFMPNFAALRAAVFPIFTKKLQGVDIRRPPPVGARVKADSGPFYF